MGKIRVTNSWSVCFNVVQWQKKTQFEKLHFPKIILFLIRIWLGNKSKNRGKKFILCRWICNWNHCKEMEIIYEDFFPFHDGKPLKSSPWMGTLRYVGTDWNLDALFSTVRNSSLLLSLQVRHCHWNALIVKNAWIVPAIWPDISGTGKEFYRSSCDVWLSLGLLSE